MIGEIPICRFNRLRQGRRPRVTDDPILLAEGTESDTSEHVNDAPKLFLGRQLRRQIVQIFAFAELTATRETSRYSER